MNQQNNTNSGAGQRYQGGYENQGSYQNQSGYQNRGGYQNPTGYPNTANYPNQNNYYRQNPANISNDKAGASDIVFGIIGMIANLLLIIAAFVPVYSQKNYYSGKTVHKFLWSFFKPLGRLAKNLRYENIFTFIVMLLMILMMILIAVAGIVYLLIYIVKLCGKKKVSKNLCANFCIVLTLFFIECISLKSMVFVKLKSVSVVMVIIALGLLLFSSMLSGYIGNMQLAKLSSKTYHLQFAFNLLTGIFSGTMVLLSFSEIIKPRYKTNVKYGLGTFIAAFFETLTDIIKSIDKRYYDTLKEVKSDCKQLSVCLVIMLLALVIVVFQVKNLKDSLKNINFYFNAGARILVRSVFTVMLLVAMQIVIASNHKIFVAKKSPGTFFVIMMIFSCVNIIIMAVKKIMEAAVPDTCAELVEGTKQKLRKKTVSCIALNTAGMLLLIGISVVSVFAYKMIEKVVKEKIRDIYDGYYDEYKDYFEDAEDYFDEYSDYYDEYKDYYDDYKGYFED